MAQWVKNLLAMLETQEILVQLLVPDDLLEDGMANHSSTLALRILWIGEPREPQSMWSQKS